ncbi:MAG: lysylphosphatidylglycerol synthase domain-containing protein [Acidithiobacillales bacterium]
MTEFPRPGGRLATRALGLAAFVVLAGFAVLIVREAPSGALPRLREARPLLLAAGALVYAAAFSLRGLRLNLLLPPGERLSGARAGTLSASALFLVQVIPFRGGELATWAAYRAALRTGWIRSGAVFAVAKLVDTAVLILVGLAGGALVALRGRSPAFGAAAALAFVAGAAALLLVPRLASAGAFRLAGRFPEGTRRRRLVTEIGEALRVAHERPRDYLASVAAATGCSVIQVGALWLMLAGFRVAASPGAVALAVFSAALVSSTIPSPVGTFGSAESGFTAALALEGVPIPLGFVTAALLHLLSTATAGLVGLPFLLGEAGRHLRDAPPR